MTALETQKNKCMKELYLLTTMLNFDKIRIEYNKNKKINDLGKIEIMPILTQFAS